MTGKWKIFIAIAVPVAGFLGFLLKGAFFLGETSGNLSNYVTRDNLSGYATMQDIEKYKIADREREDLLFKRVEEKIDDLGEDVDDLSNKLDGYSLTNNKLLEELVRVRKQLEGK